MREFGTKEDLNKKETDNSKDPGLLKNKKNWPKTNNAKCVLKLVVLRLVAFPSLVFVLVSYYIYCSWSGIQSMAQFYVTGAHLEFLEGRGLIFSKMRQICIKDKYKLQILPNTIKL